MFKPRFAHLITVAAALSAPAAAQNGVPDVAAFASSGWIEVGELAEGATLSISDTRYVDGAVLTFALKTVFVTGEDLQTVDVIELDCAAQKFRSVSAAGTKRTGEQVTSNEAGVFDSYPQGSIMAALAAPLCERVTGPQAAPAPAAPEAPGR